MRGKSGTEQMKKNKNDDSVVVPCFIDLLTESEREKYYELRSRVTDRELKFRRNRRIESFKDAMDAIKEFCVRNDSDDSKRFLVCGICWYDNILAINTRQLRILTGKCKSSINGALAKMGYVSSPSKGNSVDKLLLAIPQLEGNFLEQRQWSVRIKQEGKDMLLPLEKSNPFPKYEPFVHCLPPKKQCIINNSIRALPVKRLEALENPKHQICPTVGSDWTYDKDKGHDILAYG